MNASYAVGPLVVAAEGWPPAWRACADGWLPRAEGRPVDVTVAFDGVGLTDEESRDRYGTENLLREEKLGSDSWRLVGSGGFVGELHGASGRLTLRTRSDEEDPWLSLGNPLRGLVATLLPTRFDGLMIHACAGILDGAGVLFAGVSTAGKTTLSVDFHDVTYVSDDIALVRDCSTTPTLAPSPFFGAAGKAGPHVSAPLRAVGILVEKILDPRASSTFEVLSAARGAQELLRHVGRFTNDRELSTRLFINATELVRRVPVVLIRRSLNDQSDDVVRSLLRSAGC